MYFPGDNFDQVAGGDAHFGTGTTMAKEWMGKTDRGSEKAKMEARLRSHLLGEFPN